MTNRRKYLKKYVNFITTTTVPKSFTIDVSRATKQDNFYKIYARRLKTMIETYSKN